jgi:hypothetical protein
MKQTATEFLKTQIDNELKVIDNLYGAEIMGRKIALAFVKRILIEAKEMEKEQLLYFAKLYDDDLSEGKIRSREDLYKETFKL